ncbi:MAG: HesA/MoeB/ThiF family protein [Verrucomicrobiae bacterium]|nr:HesA/MoeB/ThiF family protein [Verrucomicrobiae bacterium]
MDTSPALLTDAERERYEWQLWVPGWGEAGQQKLKGATVLVSRVGGVGGQVAYQLAAAGVGRLVLAHGGVLRLSDLNRQLLMTHDWVGRPRVECAARRLRELNPHVEIMAVAENISAANAARLVAEADVVVDAAPLFEERYELNRQAVRQRKPMVECAMYELTAQVTTILPGETACLACLCPEKPPDWRRQFPVVGAVAGLAGCVGAMEVCKLITGVGEVLKNRLWQCDLRTMTFKTVRTRRAPECAVCGTVA